MELTYREQFEKKLQKAINKVFKDAIPSDPAKLRRMPGWKAIRKGIIEATEKTINQIQTDAIRGMYSAYGDGPAPADLKGNARARAEALADDLIAVNKRRWKASGPRRSQEDVDKWWAKWFGSERAQLIAQTETTIAHQAGEDAAWSRMEADGVATLEGYWRCERNACEFCLLVKDMPSKKWRKVYPAGPPSPHPSCQCWIEHKRKEVKSRKKKRAI